MKKLIVFALVIALSLSFVWAADTIKNTKPTIAQGHVSRAQHGKLALPAPVAPRSGHELAVQKNYEETGNAVLLEGTEPPVAPATPAGMAKPEVNPQETAKENAPVVKTEPFFDYKAAEQKEIDAQNSPILEALQAEAEKPAEIAPAYVEEPKWQPQYGEKGELLNGPRVIMLDQPDQGGPVSQGLIATTLLSENFEGTWSAGTPPTGWAQLDSGTEGTNGLWWVDKWHKFYYNAAGWYDTCLASMTGSSYIDTVQSTWAITPSFDLSAAATCSLYLKEYYDNQSTTRDSANVMVSTDDGANWTRVRTFKADSTTTRTRGINLAAYVGQSNVKVGFWHYWGGVTGSPSNTNGWVIDSVRVSVNGSYLWVQDFSNQMSGWFGNTPPTGWTINSNGSITAAPKAWNNNDWYKRASALGGSNVAAITYVGTNARREWENDWMISPSFTIGPSVACTLSFAQYYSIDNMGSQFPPNTNYAPHYGYVRISETTDGGTTWGPWSNIDVYNNASKGLSASKVFFKYDLNAWRNKTVRVAFQQVNNPDLNFGYWYIDDVTVTDYTPVLDNVGTASVSPVIATQGRNWPVKSRIYNNGQNAETFQDSAFITQPNKNTLMYQGFGLPVGWTGANPPTGWTVLDSGSVPGWQEQDWHQYYNSSSGDTVARVQYASGVNQNEWLISPSVNTVGLSNVHLTFRTYYNWEGTTDTAYIFGTVDNWATTVQIAKWYSDQGSASSLARFDFDLSSWALGATDLKIAFRYWALYDLYWYVDDAEIYESLAPTFVYTGGETVSNMPALTSMDQLFTSTWNNPAPGTYTLTSRTSLVDSVPGDNSKSLDITSYAHTGSFGPDAGGYTAKDDITGGGGAYAWKDISGIGVPVNFNFGTGNQRYTAGIGLGFNFNFYGVNKSRIFIDENGYITFDSLTSYYSTNYNFPYSSTPNNLIGLFWDDLMQSTGNAYFWTNNVDSACVSFINWGVYAAGDTFPYKFDAQVIFSGADGKIKMQYRKFDGGLTLSHSIGIENSTGTIGLQYEYNGVPMGNLPFPPLAITFAPSQDEVAATDLVSPSYPALGTGITYPVTGRVTCSGLQGQTVDVRMQINDGTSDVFDQTVYGTYIGPNSFFDVFMGNFTPVSATTHTFTMTVTNPGDEAPANNVLTVTKQVLTHEGVGGPDGGNYSWKDNTQVGGPAFNWVDLSAGSYVTFSSNDDQWSSQIYMGAPFYYYGAMKDSIAFCTNGWASFNAITASSYGVAIPTATVPNNLLAYMMSDLLLSSATTGLRYLDDVAGNRFIFEIQNAQFYSSTPSSDTFDIQVILNRNDSTVTYQYREFGTQLQTDMSIGIENGDGTIGLQYYYNATTLAGLGNYPYNGLAIQFKYTPPAMDVGMTAFTAPTGFLQIGGSYNLTATAQNYTVNQATFDVEFSVDGVAFDTATGIVLAGTSTIDVTCPTQWSPASLGSHTIAARSMLVGDNTPANDTRTETRNVFPAATVPNWSNNFESDNGGFIAVAGEWEWGVPTEAAGPSSAHSPVNLWGVDLDDTYNPSTLNTLMAPPLDLTGLVAPIFKFWMWQNTESGYDGCNVKISTDGGNTWNVITTSLAYNGTGYSGAPGIAGQPVWSGAMTTWTEVTITLMPYVGQIVLLRFDQSADGSVNRAGMYIDDASFIEPPANDVGIAAIYPSSNALLIQGYSYYLYSRVHNYGTATQYNVPVTYELYGNPPAYDNLVFTGTVNISQLEPGVDSVALFTLWTALPDSHRIVSYTSNPGDMDATNDLMAGNRYINPHVGNGGPVDYWSFSDNITGGGPAFNWQEIRSTGTPVTYSNPDDGNSGFLPMGFNFKFFGVDYNQINANVNGWLSFTDNTSTTYTNVTIPNSASPNTMIALDWKDMHLRTAGKVFYQQIGTDFIIEYDSVSYYSYQNNPFSMQLILHGADNSMTMQYQNYTLVYTDATVGIENQTGTVGLAYDNMERGQTPLNGLAVTWTFNPPPGPEIDVALDAIILDPPATQPGSPINVSARLINLGYRATSASLLTTGVGSVSGEVYNNTTGGIAIDGFDTVVVTLPILNAPTCTEDVVFNSTVTAVGDANNANDANTATLTLASVYVHGLVAEYYYWSYQDMEFARLMHKPAYGTITHAAINYQDLEEPRLTFDFLIRSDTGAPGEILYGPIEVQAAYPNLTLIDIRSIYPSLPESFYFTAVNTHADQGVATGILSDDGSSGEPGWYNNQGTGWYEMGPYAWCIYDLVDLRLPDYIDVKPLSIDSPSGTVIGLGPFPVAGSIQNMSMSAISTASAHLVITGAGGTDFDATVNDIVADVNQIVNIPFGNWAPSAGGMFTATLTVSIASENEVCNNEITSSFLAVAGNRIVYNDFESNNGGFVASPVWQYGQPTYAQGPNPLSGLNVWGTNLAGQYPSNSCDSLRTPAFTVPAEGAAMVVWVWYANEGGWDGMNIKMSVDGSAYGLVTPAGGYDDTETGYLCDLMVSQPYFTGTSGGAWLPKAVDLTEFAGSTVSFSFDFGSDGSVQYAGSYLDDFSIYSNAQWPVVSVAPEAISHTIEVDQMATYPADFSVINGGMATLNFSATNSLPWVSFGELIGAVPALGSEAIQVQIDATGIAAGVYYDTVTVNSDDPSSPVLHLPIITITVEQGGCVYIPGDINGNGVPNGIDVVFGVNYFKGVSTPPIDCHTLCPTTPAPFYAAGDVNGNCAFNGIDITFFVRYLKGQVPELLFCADCPPAPAAAPAVMPIMKGIDTKSVNQQ